MLNSYDLHRLSRTLRARSLAAFERAAAAPDRLSYDAWSHLEQRYATLSHRAYDAAVVAALSEQAVARAAMQRRATDIARVFAWALGRPVEAITVEAARITPQNKQAIGRALREAPKGVVFLGVNEVRPAEEPRYRARTTREEHLPRGFRPRAPKPRRSPNGCPCGDPTCFLEPL